MTNILQTLVVAAALIPGSVAANDLALAAESTFYPSQLKHSNETSPWIGTESGIPVPYRVGD
jgi:hypothetical protein